MPAPQRGLVGDDSGHGEAGGVLALIGGLVLCLDGAGEAVHQEMMAAFVASGDTAEGVGKAARVVHGRVARDESVAQFGGDVGQRRLSGDIEGRESTWSESSATPSLSCQYVTVANCSKPASVPKNRNRDSRMCDGYPTRRISLIRIIPQHGLATQRSAGLRRAADGWSKIIFGYTSGTQETHRRPMIAITAQRSYSLVGAMFGHIRASQGAIWIALSRRTDLTPSGASVARFRNRAATHAVSGGRSTLKLCS